MNPARALQTLLAERLGQTAGRWPRELFGEAETPTLRQAISERVSPPALRIDTPEAGLAARAPDASPTPVSNAPDEVSRAAGQPLRIYRGITDGDTRTGRYWTTDPAYASRHAQGQGAVDGVAVMPGSANFRNPYTVRDARESAMVEAPEVGGGQAWIESLRARGHDAIIDPRGNQIYVLDESAVTPAFGRAPNAPDGGPVQAGRAPAEVGAWEEGLPSPNHRFVQSGSDRYGGLVYERTSPDVWRIDSSWLPEAERGRGNGIAAYESVIRSARENGVRYVESSWATSPASQNIYNALRRRGYTVTEVASEEPGRARFRISTESPSRTGPNAGPRTNNTLAGLAALPPGALTLRELLRDRYGAA